MTTPPTSLINPIVRNGSICINTYRANCIKMSFSFNFHKLERMTRRTSPSPEPVHTLGSSSPRNFQYFMQKYWKFFRKDSPETSRESEKHRRLALDVNFFRNGGEFSVEMCLCRPPPPLSFAPQSIHILPYRRILCIIILYILRGNFNIRNILYNLQQI